MITEIDMGSLGLHGNFAKRKKIVSCIQQFDEIPASQYEYSCVPASTTPGIVNAELFCYCDFFGI